MITKLMDYYIKLFKETIYIAAYTFYIHVHSLTPSLPSCLPSLPPPYLPPFLTSYHAHSLYSIIVGVYTHSL